MKNVVVLMSTYNGEKYIREQIESILSQKNVTVTLIIRDDGSSDETLSILRSYEENCENVKVIKGNNLGYANSFMTLLKTSEKAEYYAFADQDDVWEEDKLWVAITKLEEGYSLYASSLTVVDENLNYISQKEFPNFTATVGSVLSRHRLAGCTMVFKNELKTLLEKQADKIILFNENGYGHDAWLVLFNLLYSGQLFLDKDSYIKYRRHAQTQTSIHGGLLKRIKKEMRILREKSRSRERIAKFLLENSDSFADKNASQILEQICSYKNSWRTRWNLFCTNKISTGIVVVDVINKILLLLGRY